MEKILDKESKIAELHIYTVIYSMTLFIIQCILGIFSASTSWYLFFGITGIINCAVLIRVLSIYYGLNNSWKGSYRHWKPIIVLVHGAFAESSSWDDVIQRLQAQGYTTLAAANPLRTLAGDADFVATIINQLQAPVVLVGHSYGGMVITQAARDNEKVKALVYVAAFAPEEGEDAITLSTRFPGSTLGESLWPIPLADGTADLYIHWDKFHHQFAADVDVEKTLLMGATQRPVRDVALGEASVGTPAWKSVPSWFALAELDQNIPVALQRFMAERAQAREVVEVEGASHALSVSHPEEVADLILRAAASVEPVLHNAENFYVA